MKRAAAALVAVSALVTACGGPESRPSGAPTLERGDVAPDFSLPTATGDRLSLADLRGKPTLFYFSMGPG
jgi:cytochrome oxidase Cu insertion factor (SCO1/SenC/PrrC family)